jgi:hypothetical protein
MISQHGILPHCTILKIFAFGEILNRNSTARHSAALHNIKDFRLRRNIE